MGNSKSKKAQKEPEKFFERERWKEQKRKEKKKINVNPINKRTGVGISPTPPVVPAEPPGQGPAPTAAQIRSYHDEALDRMRYQLHHDSDAFLLNNILLSVQFFENYEREMQHIKNNPSTNLQHLVDEAMVRHHKHVFFADRLHECVQEHVYYQRPTYSEALTTQKLYVIYDNIEASDPRDTSDYSAVLDAPFYKLQIEDCKEQGYVKLKKIEVLESTLSKETDIADSEKLHSDDSLYADSETESNDSDDYSNRGKELLQKINNKIETNILNANNKANGVLVIKPALCEENDVIATEIDNDENEVRPRKSILKNPRRLSGPIRDVKNKTEYKDVRKILSESIISEDTETSGYRSNSSSRQNESSETESDYGYSTITESATPKRVELSIKSSFSLNSGVLPDECWSSIQIQAMDDSDDEDDDVSNNTSKSSTIRNLYDTYYFLCSSSFMTNFVDNFLLKLGFGLGFTQDAINNSLTQGASIYCNTTRNGLRIGYEVFPALLAAWPNAANEWIIRFRKPIENPRTKCKYQWPIKYMINKTVGIGSLLVPLGFRPKRGLNSDQKLQWKVIFPAAERYLESCLAHSHIRCYLFALTLHKTFIENETSKIGIDGSHIKNHLFWQCEDNYAKWPEDRLGEALRLFLRSFYVHLGQARLPNYFIESCNDFKSIPKPLLLKQQRRLADILEAPVMHVLKALQMIKYNKKEFYPTFNYQRLYNILTCKNPLRLLNPNLPVVVSNNYESSGSEDENCQNNFWDRTKNRDKHYQWKKERQRQMQVRRKAAFVRKQKPSQKQEIEIDKNIIIPQKMEAERRRLVFEFFIPHFIAMARSSEKFDSIKQALIYLEQARRLCYLLLEEPASVGNTANEYLDVIRDKLADCQRKLANQDGYNLPPRRQSRAERSTHSYPNYIKQRPKYHNIVNLDSPNSDVQNMEFTFADVHVENSVNRDIVHLTEINGEESKL